MATYGVCMTLWPWGACDKLKKQTLSIGKRHWCCLTAKCDLTISDGCSAVLPMVPSFVSPTAALSFTSNFTLVALHTIVLDFFTILTDVGARITTSMRLLKSSRLVLFGFQRYTIFFRPLYLLCVHRCLIGSFAFHF